MDRFTLLLSVFIAALTVYAVAGKATNGKPAGTPPGKNPCVGGPRLNDTCDMGYWTGICIRAYDKLKSPGHQICFPHCNTAPVLNPADNVDVNVNYDWENAYDGNTTVVQCADGYAPADYADMTITCVLGKWSSFNGKCLKVCANPESETITNMYLTTDTTGQTFTEGDRLEFECNPNHVAFGCSYSECQADGSWNTVGDGCTAVCTAPDSDHFANAGPDYSLTYYLEGTVVPYSCDTNFSPEGTLTATCTNGAIQYSSGSCVADCGDPPSLPPHTSIASWDGDTTAGSVIQLQCKAGYESAIDPSFTCDDSTSPASWQQAGDLCTLIEEQEEDSGCQDDPPTGYSSSDGETATQTCSDQTTVLTINCEGSSWGTTTDTCPPDSTGCGSPPAKEDVLGATTGPTLNTAGNEATYSCDENSVYDTATAICEGNQWVIQDGGCQSIEEECSEKAKSIGFAAHVNKCVWNSGWCTCVYEPTLSHAKGIEDCTSIGVEASPSTLSRMAAITDLASYNFLRTYGDLAIKGIDDFWFSGKANSNGVLIDGNTNAALAYTDYVPSTYDANTCGVFNVEGSDWQFTDCGETHQNLKQKTICQIYDPRP